MEHGASSLDMDSVVPATSLKNPLIIPLPPLSPPPPLQPSSPSLGAKYVMRHCAQLDKVLEEQHSHNFSLCGPKGPGKTTTLKEAYHSAISKGENAYYIDVASVLDELFAGLFSCGDYYFFVDNAQLLRRCHFPNLTRVLQRGKVCLAFSSTVVETGVGELSY